MCVCTYNVTQRDGFRKVNRLMKFHPWNLEVYHISTVIYWYWLSTNYYTQEHEDVFSCPQYCAYGYWGL